MPVELKIVANDNGTLSLYGPINNIVQCYGLLELAKDALREMQAEKQRAVRSPMPADIAAFVKR